MKFVIDYNCAVLGCQKIVDASNEEEAKNILLATEPGAKIISVAPSEE